MTLCPSPPRDLTVCNIADEDVPERVLRLADNRGASVAPNEVFALEREQTLLDPPARQTAKRDQSPGPKGPSDDRCILEERLLTDRKSIEAGCNDGLDGLGEREIYRVSPRQLRG